MFGRCLVITSLLAIIAGCGESNPPTQKVSGTVTLDGTAVEGATVMFLPDDSSAEAAVGQTNSAGGYELTTFISGDGAMLGSYKIQVSKYETAQGGPSPYDAAAEPELDPNREMTEEEEIANMEKGYAAQANEMAKAQRQGARGGSSRPKNDLPDKYAKVASSGLTFTVTEGENTYDIELTK